MGFEEEVEGVDDRHVRDEVDFDAELAGFIRKDEAGEEVALRILLPVEEVIPRFDAERVTVDGGPRMLCRPQAHDLRRQRHQAIVEVLGFVMQRDPDAHSASLTSPVDDARAGGSGHGSNALSARVEFSFCQRRGHGDKFKDLMDPIG